MRGDTPSHGEGAAGPAGDAACPSGDDTGSSGPAARSDSAGHRFRRRLVDLRARLDPYPRWRLAYRVAVAIVGAVVIVVGLILVPLPGPGWLIVFIGLAVLSTEFHWARRLTHWVREQLTRVRRWGQEHARRARRADRAFEEGSARSADAADRRERGSSAR